ncbi:MAG: response regulator, partial [Bacteroidota bacterium]
MIKAAIIEDEINQRELLHHQIRMQLPEITEILEAGNGEEGLALIYAQQPDLIFLDISMPIMDGFTMLKTIDQSSVKPFEVIVVTVSDNRAVEAYRLSSLDYLVKPVSDALLKEAFEKFKDRWELKLKIQDLQEQVAAVEHNINNQSEPLMAIYHHFDGYLYFKPKKEVVYLEADSQYTFVHMANRKTFHQANTLKVYETMLVDH